MKKLLTALFGAALILAACGGDDPVTEPAPTETPATDETAAGAYDVAAAESTYQKSCAMCHGGNLEGQGSNPALVGTGLSKDDVVAILTEGQGAMPGGLVKDQAELENLAAWVAAQ
jgi:cytochrome c551